MSATSILHLPHTDQVDLRTPRQQYLDGFDTCIECEITGDYLSSGELASLTADEMRGYKAAIAARDFAEFTAYRYSRNAFGDLTEY